MRVVVTGARGRLGKISVSALANAGHTVVATDVEMDRYPRTGESCYIQADLTDAGQAFAVIGGADAVVHVAAKPNDLNPAHVLYANNALLTFNCVEAATRMGVKRFVNISSEATLGFQLAPRPFWPDYLPVDEGHPMKPQDPYSLAKACGEHILDAAVARSDMTAISLRPSWIQFESNIEFNVGELVRDKARGATISIPTPIPTTWPAPSCSPSRHRCLATRLCLSLNRTTSAAGTSPSWSMIRTS